MIKKSKNTPLVSIVINIFNGERYIEEALKTVFKQTYKNWEVIFWDNKSTDDSKRIFNKINDVKFSYFESKSHTTLYKARKKAIEKTKGELIAFIDCDDIWEPNKLELQVPLFTDEEVGFSCGQYQLLNQRKKVITKKFSSKYLPSGYVTSELLEDYFINLSSIVVRKKTLLKLDITFDERFTIIGDFDMCVRLSLVSKLASVNKVISIYRWHSNNTGIKENYKISDEFNLWVKEYKYIIDDLNKKTSLIFLNKVTSYNLIKHAYRGEKYKIIKMWKNLNFFYRLKAIFALSMPVYITRYWINRDN